MRNAKRWDFVAVVFAVLGALVILSTFFVTGTQAHLTMYFVALGLAIISWSCMAVATKLRQQ